ncbi:BREX-2 system phosphatase PglZ [Agromyces italicus]|uniref:BREX-2 system phosphatase PglZ n=1 Tax=Agromyces italicus TaxID=279572 RepID=UPI0005270E19|nr:BREX-2 system phosphatase PglZ [Agromyces italicus]
MASGESWAPTLDTPTLWGRVAQWRSDPKRRTEVLLLRAASTWTGGETITVGSEIVRVVVGNSQLAVLDAYHEHAAEPIVVLTALDDQQLGSAVRLRAERHSVQSVDAWELVPGLFKVGNPNVDKSVRDLGAWLPQMLLSHQRAAGWPVATSGTLSGDHVVRAILADLTGLDGVDEVDLIALLDHLDEPQTSARLLDYRPEELTGIIAGAQKHLGGSAALALHAKRRATTYSTLAVALVTDLLWNEHADAPETAKVRLEERFFATKVVGAEAKLLGEAAHSVILRLEAAGDTRFGDVLRQAEAILTDLGWAEGATGSALLPAGLEARYKAFASAVDASAEAVGSVGSDHSVEAVDRALAEVRAHDLAARDVDELLGVEMAARLVRWLARPAAAAPGSFDHAAAAYWHGSAWADRARSVTWNGSSRPALASAYAALAERVTARRDAEDAGAAAMLGGDTPTSVIPIEALLERVVAPLASAGVLLIVLDGMSAAVAAELADETRRLRWVEVLPEEQTQRLTALATLPSVTRYSRSSLFAGRLTDGNQGTEKPAFKKQTGGPLFHKDELRSPAGQLLPAEVESAIADSANKVVGVVLNTIDDALAKADPDATRWTLAQIANLPALLTLAAAAGRTVVLTSDHGHVIERGGEYRAEGSGGARWRAPDAPATPDEVFVSGPRVLAPGGSAVVARNEGLRYAPKSAGYHGGASLAELTVPIVVLRPAGVAAPNGWQDAPPQAPEWWYDGGLVEASTPVAPVGPKKRVSKAKSAPTNEVAMFDIPVVGGDEGVAATVSLSAALLASELYAAQRDRLKRRSLDDATVALILDTADERGGRVPAEMLATLLRVSAAALEQILAVLRRLLNVDGFDVVAIDTDGTTVLVDRQLLREQFGLR